VNASVLTQHLLISLLPWLVGVIIAGGLGTVWAPAARSLFSRLPALQSASMLLPWRTVALSLSLLSPLVVMRVGLGAVAAGIVVGLFVFILALPFTVVVRLEEWYASLPIVRFIAWSRTLAVASVVVAAVVAPMVGGGGAGSLIFGGLRALNYTQMVRGFAVVVVLALTIDLVLGALQLLLAQGRP
jgi:ABC-type proline/glycine betaine transport system permease subunit